MYRKNEVKNANIVYIRYHGSLLVFSIKSWSNRNKTPAKTRCSITNATFRDKADLRAEIRFKTDQTKSEPIFSDFQYQLKYKQNHNNLDQRGSEKSENNGRRRVPMCAGGSCRMIRPLFSHTLIPSAR